LAYVRHFPTNVSVTVRLPVGTFAWRAQFDYPHWMANARQCFALRGIVSAMITDDIVALLPDLRAFARFMCREREAADDLVQNTIVAALNKRDQFMPGTNLKAWMFTIMRNRFYSDLRTQRRRPAAIDTDSAPPLAAVDNPEASIAMKELSTALWQLSAQAREALILVGAGGFSYEEASRLCGCTVGTLKVRVSRARKQLARKLN
jgi:RNA polymerase sigma-70 factor, ECF subfamily